MEPGRLTTIIMFLVLGFSAYHFRYLVSGTGSLNLVSGILRRYWQEISAVVFMSWFVVYRLVRFIWIKWGRKETGAMTAYTGHEFGSGNMPLEAESPMEYNSTGERL